MRVPGFDALVAEFDSATHSQRVRRMAELGRDVGATVELGELIDLLAAGGPSEHELGLVAAVAARDRERVAAAMTDPNASVRSFAVTHAVQAGLDPADLSAALVDGSQVDRAQLRRVLVRRGPAAIGDPLIDPVRVLRGDREAAGLLGACRAATVRRLLPELDYAVANWSTLARRHPAIVLDHLTAVLREARRQQRDQLWATAGAGIAALAATNPEEVLVVLEEHGPSRVIPQALLPRLGGLTRYAPARVAALLLRAGHREVLVRYGLPVGVRNNARHLPDEARAALANALAANERTLARFLAAFAPADRERLFEAAYAGTDTSNRTWSRELLDVLPRAVRHREARRMLSMRSVQANPTRAADVAAFLPLVEARAELDAVLAAAKPEDRARGYRLLIECAGRSRDPQQIADAFERVRRVRNEQDPVRMAACQALTSVPPSAIGTIHEAPIAEVITAVIDARDTSAATVRLLRDWILAILHAHALEPDGSTFAFALASLDRLAGPSGTISFGRLDHDLPRGSEVPLLAALLARLEADADHDRYDLTLALATSLGRRADRLDELHALIGRATAHPLDSVARRAVALWLGPPRTRSERLDVLVRRDPSMVALDPVLSVINRQRQDLLDIVLTDTNIQGRFLTGNVRFVPLLHGGFRHWLPRQHRAYARSLRLLIDDPASKPWAARQAIRTLAQLPEIGLDAITVDLAATDIGRVEAALAALAWTDAPQLALTELLAYAGGDRARVASYAATRCARFIPPGQLTDALVTVASSSDAKITARKEAIRLIAAHRPPQALETLLALAEQPGLHRDLRIAIGRSLRSFLDDPRAWGVVRELADGEPEGARSLVDTAPRQLAVRHRAAFGEAILAVAQHPEPIARGAALAALPHWAPWTPDAPDVARRAIEDLGSGDSWHAAAIALTTMCRDGLADDALTQLVTHLVSQRDDPADDAAPQRDLPRRQRLLEILGRVNSLAPEDLREQRRLIAAVIDILQPDPTLLHQEIALRLALVDWPDTTWIETILARVDQRPHAAMAASQALKRALDKATKDWEPDQLLPAVDPLITRGRSDAALLALAITTTAGPRSGWNEHWRTRLRRLRATNDPDITAFADLSVTSKE